MILSMETTKKCSKCGHEKPTNQFSRNRSQRDGLQAHCRKCSNAYARARYEAERPRLLAEMKEYREANQEAIAARRKARNAANPEPNRTRARRWNRANRAVAIEIYGGRCVECGSTDRLELDHVNTDGNVHRAREAAQTMHGRIARAGCRLDDWDLQLLCATHHRAKTDAERRAATADRDAEILRLRSRGGTMRDIASAVGCSIGTVHRIIVVGGVDHAKRRGCCSCE
jgi:hypothetical protein